MKEGINGDFSKDVHIVGCKLRHLSGGSEVKKDMNESSHFSIVESNRCVCEHMFLGGHFQLNMRLIKQNIERKDGVLISVS